MIYPLLPIFIYLEPQKRTVISTCLKEISTGHDAVFFRLSVCRVSNEQSNANAEEWSVNLHLVKNLANSPIGQLIVRHPV